MLRNVVLIRRKYVHTCIEIHQFHDISPKMQNLNFVIFLFFNIIFVTHFLRIEEEKGQIWIRNNETGIIYMESLLKENNSEFISRNIAVLFKLYFVCQADLIFNIQSKPNSANKLSLELEMKSR